MDFMTQYARDCGKLPDRYWYQLNGQTVQQNFAEQRQKIYESLAEPEDSEETMILFQSEVNVK